MIDISKEAVENSCRAIHDMITERKIPAHLGVMRQAQMRALSDAASNSEANTHRARGGFKGGV